MKQKIECVKYQNCGNDYIYINDFSGQFETGYLSNMAKIISDRHFGIGSDGLIVLKPSRKAGIRMMMFNSDGSTSPMCGNGVRGLAQFVRDERIVNGQSVTIETGDRIVTARYLTENLTEVDMGKPVFVPDEIPFSYPKNTENRLPFGIEKIDSREFLFYAVSMGNPHAVIFVDDQDFNIDTVGPVIEKSVLFPQKTNVSFVKINSKNSVTYRVWERGAGTTLSCGTGVCASFAVARVLNLLDREAAFSQSGGELIVREDSSTGHMLLRGQSILVFRGSFYFSNKDMENA